MVSQASLLRLEQHTEVFGKTCTFMCLFLPSLTDLSHDWWWVTLFTLSGENFLVGEKLQLGHNWCPYPAAPSLRETLGGLLLIFLFLSLHCVISLQVFSKHSDCHNNHALSHLMITTQHRLHSFVMILKYLYCIPLYVVEFKMQRNPEFTIKKSSLLSVWTEFYFLYVCFLFSVFSFLHLHSVNGICMHFCCAWNK